MYTKDQIDELLNDVLDLANRIKSVDKLITTISNQELRAQYDGELLEMISSYKQLAKLLETQIESYIKEEKKQKLPAELSYRRVLRELKKV